MMSTEIKIPDIGSSKAVDVIEVLVKPGDRIEKNQSLVTLESDKASMDVPSPEAGQIKSIQVKVGDKVSEGSVIVILEGDNGNSKAKETKPSKAPEPKKVEAAPAAQNNFAREMKDKIMTPEAPSVKNDNAIYAGPAVRRLARLLNADLSRISGSGSNQRITREDLLQYVKTSIKQAEGGSAGGALPRLPQVDFAQFGEVEAKPLSKIKKLTAENLHRVWVNLPQVTQFDKADITDLEAFRVAQKAQAKSLGFNITLLPFVMKAVVQALRKYPQFNSSLDASGENIIYKKYFHMGVAVDTPKGLVVPVIKNVDQKSVLALAQELSETSERARSKGLLPNEMTGQSFTISSLGGVGGSAFTPIVNWPDVAILGLSKAEMQPVWNGQSFAARLMLPLSLSYDHRVIDGVEAARFCAYLAEVLTDIRKILL